MGIGMGNGESIPANTMTSIQTNDLQASNWRSEAALEANAWHNALAVTVLHGSIPGDPQTIPTCMPSSVLCACLQKQN